MAIFSFLLPLLFAASFIASISGATIQKNWALNTHNTDTVTVGDTITWTWTDGFNHDISQNGGTNWNPALNNQPVQQQGHTFSYTFNNAGTFNYYCSIHGSGSMSGTVTVNAAAGGAVSSSSTGGSVISSTSPIVMSMSSSSSSSSNASLSTASFSMGTLAVLSAFSLLSVMWRK